MIPKEQLSQRYQQTQHALAIARKNIKSAVQNTIKVL